MPAPAVTPVVDVARTTQDMGAFKLTGALVEHRKVTEMMDALASRCKRGGASSVMFLPGNKTDFKAYAFAYGTHLAKKMNINAAPKDGVVRGTVVINPSGHVPADMLKRFASSNTYSVRVTLPDGKVLQKSGISRNDPSSEEYATKISIEFPYMSGTTVLEAWPDGSARTGGYLEGRKYEIHSHDAPFDRSSARVRAHSDF